MNGKNRQTGSVLVPLIIVAIIIVLVIMWQAGMFSGAGSSDTDAHNNLNNNPATLSGAANTDGPGNAPAEGQNSSAAAAPDRELTEGEKAAIRAKNFQSDAVNPVVAGSKELATTPATNSDSLASTEAAAIDTAAAELLTNHVPDFSACRSLSDKEKALECAAGAQTVALKAAFEAHNARRTSGDAISINRGGEIMQRVITSMQNALSPFVEAADGS